ncbi:helix-turn-helix domain-containing protein [Chryseobacterium sp. ISL-6]|uniref:helix-turn-helix domain-containing protein n=1 Tax=Chryseobacterium sp. ISL-6 TaxID=2819143 RepID=UPI001BE5D68E|nr:helix-turn-helix domain-containing protein [Chryseobacterium sp. ISL-6]MBT2621234.1 helix-turn-helix domain-containing protein [Chryseobacterium sp. ISL-6]
MTPIQLQQELNEIKKLVHQNYINNKEVFNSTELISYLKISESLLYKLTSRKLIPHCKPTNGVLLFFKEEIHDWIKQHRIYTIEDAQRMIRNHKRNRTS